MSKLIKPDALADEIVSLMQQYADEVTSDLKKDVDSVARATVIKVKEKAPVKKSGVGSKYVPGSYKNSWTSTTESENSHRKNRVVYAKGHQYSLTHLLENGHELVLPTGKKGRRVAPIIHIKPAEEWAVNEFEQRTLKRIREKS